ncbi:hypothetical protein N7G274_003918 [Stereocaulon virgatum]|uniref:Uncharacterized protein n=1 Tax=Stereocaulon virgatum TaxID=373712 RepID=A0ABR4AFK2_9LECA
MGRHIRVLVIPSDGYEFHMIHIKTVALEANAPNAELGHHPDFHRYWGLEGWERRIATRMRVENSTLSILNGKYYLFRSLADAHLEPNKHVGGHCFGDAFVVKVLDDGTDEQGDAAYEDVPKELLRSNVIKKMVMQLAEPTEK